MSDRDPAEPREPRRRADPGDETAWEEDWRDVTMLRPLDPSAPGDRRGTARGGASGVPAEGRYTDENLWQRSASGSERARDTEPADRGRPGSGSGAGDRRDRAGERDTERRGAGEPSGRGRRRRRPPERPDEGSWRAFVGLLGVLAVAILGTWGLRALAVQPGETAEQPQGVAETKPLDRAELPDSVGDLRRDRSKDQDPPPTGYRDIATYLDVRNNVELLAVSQSSPVHSLEGFEQSSGMPDPQRFGDITCARSDQRPMCVMLLSGGLLVTSTSDLQVDMETMARRTQQVFDALPD